MTVSKVKDTQEEIKTIYNIRMFYINSGRSCLKFPLVSVLQLLDVLFPCPPVCRTYLLLSRTNQPNKRDNNSGCGTQNTMTSKLDFYRDL